MLFSETSRQTTSQAPWRHLGLKCQPKRSARWYSQ